MNIALAVALALAGLHDNPPEKFLGTLKVGGIPFAVMSTTESVLDGKPTPYVEIPDDETELISISIDLRRNVVTRVVYITRKDI